MNKLHELERNNVEYSAGLNTYKQLFDVSSNQARTLKLTNKRREDEEENLLYALRELQATGEDKTKQGRIYYILMLSRWQEAAANKKYDYVMNDVRNLRGELSNHESRLKKEEEERQDAEIKLSEKCLDVERLKQELSSK